MNAHRAMLLGAALAATSLFSLSGCSNNNATAPPTAPTPVKVAYPIEKYVTEYAEFTGRTAAVDSVEVRARVFGYLQKVNFKEGAMVKKNDVLFEIDPAVYEALLNQAKSKVALDEAQLRLAESEYQRSASLRKTSSVSQEDLEKAMAARDVASASLAADRAAVVQRQLDWNYTKVRAPVSGRVGRALVTEGNLVQSGEQSGGTLLTTLVSIDPIYAYFDVDENTMLRVQKLIREGKAKSARNAPLPVDLALANEENFPHKGVINFVDNQVNFKTSTLRVRGVFPNEKEVLTTGVFVRVRVPIGEQHQAILISDRAIDTDLGQKIVYVVDEQNKVTVRPIQPGPLQDGLREITSGLKATDRVIISGLQNVRPGITVEPTVVEMAGRLAATR